MHLITYVEWFDGAAALVSSVRNDTTIYERLKNYLLEEFSFLEFNLLRSISLGSKISEAFVNQCITFRIICMHLIVIQYRDVY